MTTTPERLFTPPPPGSPGAGGRATLHRQAPVHVGQFTAMVDHELVPLITELWRRELWTLESCQDNDNPGRAGMVFVAFLSLDEARRFCRAVLDAAAADNDEALAERVEWAAQPYDDDAPAPPGRPWTYTRLPDHDPDDEDEDLLHNDEDAPLVLADECICVNFPRTDLAKVLDAVRRFDGHKRVQQVHR